MHKPNPQYESDEGKNLTTARSVAALYKLVGATLPPVPRKTYCEAGRRTLVVFSTTKTEHGVTDERIVIWPSRWLCADDALAQFKRYARIRKIPHRIKHILTSRVISDDDPYGEEENATQE